MMDLLLRRRNLLIRKQEEEMDVRAVCFKADGEQTVSLFAKVSIAEYPDWVQPTGATDAYNKGDKVTYEGKHWVSMADANVWQPGVYGWEEV